jgi:peptidyl-prolyl cis-trans isomerase B (cyclophilin B)
VNRRPILALILAIPVVASFLASCGGPSLDPNKLAVLETSYGKIVFEFYPESAPKHTLAFQQMISEGFFDGTQFHRVIPGRAIQGGDPNSKNDDPSDDGLGSPSQATIPAEFSTTLKHVRGTVSAARKGNDQNSATSQFFICTGTESAFDGQYSIFGHVIEGMNVVDLIANAPLLAGDPKLRERPVNPVTVTRAYLATRAELGLPVDAATPAAK